jgi:molecular chaperone DnaK
MAKRKTTSDQRKHPRVSLNLLVQVDVESIDVFKNEHCANISLGGMFLKTKDVRPLGSSLFFQLKLKDGGPLIEGQAKVVRVEKDGMGVEFESLLEPSKSIVAALVAERA